MHRPDLQRRYDLLRMLLACAALLCAGIVHAATYSVAATTFSWIDPSTHSNAAWTSGASCSSSYANAPVDDDITAQIPLGFTFNFGGVNYTTVQIMSNGRLQFNNGYCGYGTQTVGPPRTYPVPIPNASMVRTMKVYAADFDASAGGTVRYASLGSAPNRTFVVTWSSVPEWNSPSWNCTQSCFNVQVILHENGDFVYQFGSSLNPSNGHADIGWELTTSDYGLYAYSNVGALTNTAIRFFIPANIAEYRMEEAAWSGAGAVTDSSGNGHNGTAVGPAQTVAGGYLCRGANIPANTGINTVDGINTGIVVDSTLTAAGAVTFWYKGNAAWNDGNDRMLLDGTSNNGFPFFLSKRSDGRLRFVLHDSSNNVFVDETGSHSLAANGWHHIAITWGLGGSGHMSVYLDGALDQQIVIAAAATLNNKAGALYIGDNQGVAISNNATGNSANGVIDEVKIYNYEIPSTVVSRDYLLTRSCSVIDHFAINIGSAAASTCVAKNISVTAQDATNNTVTNYNGVVSLTTSTAHGDWSAVSANGVLNNGAADDGAASYGFVAADNGVITLALSDSHADNLAVTVQDPGAGVSSASSTINFRDNVFVITNDAIQVAGRNQSMSAALWRKDPGTGNCSIATTYTGARPLKAWLTRDASDPGGAAPAINAVSLPNAQPGASNLSLTFSNGTASFSLASTDVGKYALNLLDDTRSFATGVDISGASNSITTRPFGLAFTNIRLGTTVNPGGANPTDAVFGAAGVAFQATLGGYLWQAADDVNNDGVPDAGANLTDNGLAAHFAWPVTLTATLNTPSGGTLGALGGTTSIAQANFAGGAATVGNLTYSEVGSMQLSANASSYLNSGGVNLSGSSGVVGRFIPDHFATGALVNGSLSNGCGSFTYTGQQSGGRGAIRYLTAPQFTISAQSATNTTTVNYTGAFRKLAASGISISKPTTDATQLGADNTNKVNLTANLNAGTLTDNGNGTLSYVLGNDDFAYVHEANSQIAPFTSAINLIIAAVQEPAADGVVANDLPKTLAPTGVEIRFGRLNLQNAYGSELLDLPINLTAEYWVGTAIGFVSNGADACTGVAAGNVTVTPNAPLLAGDTRLVVAANPFVSGSWHASATGPYSHLTTPGAGKQGSVDLSIDLDAAGLGWLKYDWSGSGYSNPGARAVFGIYQGPERRIYLRERYN